MKKTSSAKLPALIQFLVGIAICALAAWLNSIPMRFMDRVAAVRLETSLNLAADNAVNVISGLQRYLGFISRMPELREALVKDDGAEVVKQYKDSLDLLIDSFEQETAIIYQRYLRSIDAARHLAEMPPALFRRLQVELEGKNPDEIEEPQHESESQATPEQMRQQTAAVRNFLASVKNMLNGSIAKITPFIGFITSNLTSGKTTAQNSSLLESLFAVAQHEKMIKAMVLKSLNGNVAARYGDAVMQKIENDDRDCRAISGGVTFYNGPVAYDAAEKTPVWWVSLPVRDQRREAVMCLSAVIDLSFLSDIARQVQEQDAELLFVESMGNTIGSADDSQVEQMISMNSLIQRIGSWQNVPASYPKLRENGSAYFLGGINFSREDMRHQPDWKIIGRVSASHLSGPGNYLYLLCVIVLAATGLYALSCSLMRLLNFSLSEEE